MSSIIHACGLVGLCGGSLVGLLGFAGDLLRACGGSLAGLRRALAGFRCPFKEGPKYRRIPPPEPDTAPSPGATSGDLFATSPGCIKGFPGTVAGLVREGSKTKKGSESGQIPSDRDENKTA